MTIIYSCSAILAFASVSMWRPLRRWVSMLDYEGICSGMPVGTEGHEFMATVENVLREVQELSPDEQRRLLELLIHQAADIPDEIRQIRNKVAHQAPTTPEERAAARAALDGLDRVAAQVGAAWKSDKSALEAVQEQRRDL